MEMAKKKKSGEHAQYSSTYIPMQIQFQIRHTIPVWLNTASLYDCFRCLGFHMQTCIGDVASCLSSSHRRRQLNGEGWRGSMARFSRVSGNVLAGVYGGWKCHSGSAISGRFKNCKCLLTGKSPSHSISGQAGGFFVSISHDLNIF